MNKKMKLTPFSACISFTKQAFPIIMMILALFFFIGQLIFPDERDKISTACERFSPAWERIYEDGSRVSVTVPGAMDASYGEEVVLSAVLPGEIVNGEYLCFRSVWQDVAVYIAGELRLEYSTQNSRPFGTNSTSRYLFVPLSEEDSGEELTYHFSSNSKYAGKMYESYIGDLLSIWIHLTRYSILSSATAIFLLIMSLSCITICYIFKWVYRKTLPLKHLAWTIFLCALWMLTMSGLCQIVTKNMSILSYYSYLALMLAPIPMLLYINELQHGRYKKIMFYPLMYCISSLAVITLLQILDIVQFVQSLPFIHAGVLASILCVIATISYDTIGKHIHDYLFVGIGVYGMLLTVIGEFLFYYLGTSFLFGTTLVIGLLFLFIMAIIQTGQDLFYSEKEKHQAIMAKEAQAKFLANMSHEIRTPINAIVGMNEMILRESEDASIRDYAHNIQSASSMLLGLVNDILDFSKIESGQLELVEDTYSFASMMQDEIILLQARAAGRPVSTQLDINYSIPAELYGDELRIKQILTNLLSNAVKYTPHGTVTLSAFSRQLDSSHCMLCFSVADTGIGIREEDMSKLFDSFKRLELHKNRAIQGSGLGLNISKQLVELMHGHIEVQSEYGKGSVFSVSIPQKVINWKPIRNLEASLETWRKEHQASKIVFTAPDASILVIDDNVTNLSLMKGLLKRTQIKVDVAEGGREGLALTRQHRYQIIFMDHMMPELDGVEALHILRSEASNPNCDTTVIALTANAVAGCREMYLGYGFHDYFAKPIQADRLDELIMKYLPEELVLRTPLSASSVLTEETAPHRLTAVTAAPQTGGEPPAAHPDNHASVLEISREAGLSYCLNSEELYRTVLSAFCEEAGETCKKLEECYLKHDWKSYAIYAHGLKSSSLHIGAEHFSELSRRHEFAAKESNIGFIDETYEEYIHSYKELVKKLESNLA